MCQMLRGRAHIALLVQTYPPFSLSSHSCTHMHTDTQGCRKAHTERHSPPLCSLPSSCCFPPPRSCLCMSQEVMSKIITGLLHQRRNKVLFYWEPITDNSQISLSLMKMYACTQPALIVLIRRKGARTCVRVHVPELSLCMYSMCVSAHVYVCRIHDEHLCTAQRRVQATCSIFMCFPICDPAL